ncbi:RDD family protein [Bacillus timonensis]|uniref:RDD family protein n=1 Tax=Bacillus timonensis TaxID=1033734 RepID=UPI0005A9176C|nr:RDD family protein [Bacillus timonensis]
MDITHEEVQGNNLVQDDTTRLVGKAIPRYAGFWMRFWAYLLDLVVISSINRILINPIFRALDLPLSESSMFSAASISTAIVFYLYFVLMTKFFSQTLGKMVFGIKVVSLDEQSLTWGTVLFRELIGRYISKLFFIGYLIVAFLPKKQGIHDLLSDTTVVHAPK